jgi:predicted  nucleic acid-binding Zn-ribbon protein
MAERKTKAEELPVEKKLQNLYKLQTILSEIDKIKTLRGELPLEVQDLEDELAGLKTRIDNIKKETTALKAEIAARKTSIEQANGLVAKYTEQQNNVRNNREYDFLSKEIEFQTLEVQLSEKKMGEATALITERQEALQQAKGLLVERTKDLEAKRAELDEIVQDTRAEEETLRDKSKRLEGSIEARLLTAFKRIRKASRNGLGVVYVQRDACGGCFNKIPPQRQMDIRQRKKIIVCEYCGRIMIDKELAGVKD